MADFQLKLLIAICHMRATNTSMGQYTIGTEWMILHDVNLGYESVRR